jgi:hypothetical protein
MFAESMTPPELWKRWKVTEAHLEHARGLLPAPTADVAAEYDRLLSDYRSYLDHNELELALDTLQEFADLVPCRGGYWRNLERAAETMELHDRIPHLRARFEQAGKERA